MSEALAERRGSQVMNQTPERKPMNAMDMVSVALERGAGVEQVDKLIELVKFNDAREALREFNQAFTAAQAEFPDVEKVKAGHNNKFAPLSYTTRLIRPVLKQHGLSYRHEVSENDNHTVTVRCILAHQAGHSESASLTAPADDSGKKNAIQAIGSTVSYLRRYTLEAVTGLVTLDSDTEGYVPPENTPKRDKLVKDLKAAAEKGNEEFKQLWGSLDVGQKQTVGVYEFNNIKAGVAK